MSGTLVSGTNPFSSIPRSGTRSVRGRAPSPDPSSIMTGIIDTHVVSPPPPAAAAASEAGSNATLERITALESQVCSLEAKFMELLVKLDEVSSCVSTSSTPRRQAAAGASPTASNMTFGDLQSQDLPDAPPPVDVAGAVHLATREWVVGPKTPVLPDVSPMHIATQEAVEGPKAPEHTIEHPEGYRPVNCSCSVRARAVEIGPVLANELKAEGSLFSGRDLAGRGNLF